MPEPTPNPQAVEAIPLDAENAALEAFQAAGDGSAPYTPLMAALNAAMPHIRSQLLTELAEEPPVAAMEVLAASLSCISVDRFRRELAEEPKPKDGILGRHQTQLHTAEIYFGRCMSELAAKEEK